jgi:hypothetical protein
MNDERRAELTDHDVAEKVRARKQRSRWGSAVAVIGILAALVSAFYQKDYAMTALFLGVGLVGAGFVEPALIASKFGKK